MVRKRFVDDIEAVAAGAEPKAIVRDPAANRRIDLPIIGKHEFIAGLPADRYVDHDSRQGVRSYIFQAGQPEAVRAAWEAAMGFERAEPPGGVLEILAPSGRPG
jgi:5,5'-dehydrodivanillate O-demethylase